MVTPQLISTRRFHAPLFGLLCVIGMFLQASPRAHGYWRLVWSDEFNGTSLESTKWTYDIGNGYISGGVFVPGWGNHELQYYTRRPNNVNVSEGVVHIIARKEYFSGSPYTSARIKTAGIFFKKYGRFEFRAK